MDELIKRLRESVDSPTDRGEEKGDVAQTNGREEDSDLRELLLSQLNARDKEDDLEKTETSTERDEFLKEFEEEFEDELEEDPEFEEEP